MATEQVESFARLSWPTGNADRSTWEACREQLFGAARLCMFEGREEAYADLQFLAAIAGIRGAWAWWEQQGFEVVGGAVDVYGRIIEV